MHLSISFVVAALMAWQAAAGHVHRASDPHHARMGTVVRRQQVADAPELALNEPALPQESDTPSPAMLGLMARIKGDIARRPVLSVAPVQVDGATNVTQTGETEVPQLLGEPDSGAGPEEPSADQPSLVDPDQSGTNTEPKSADDQTDAIVVEEGSDDPVEDPQEAVPAADPVEASTPAEDTDAEAAPAVAFGKRADAAKASAKPKAAVQTPAKVAAAVPTTSKAPVKAVKTSEAIATTSKPPVKVVVPATTIKASTAPDVPVSQDAKSPAVAASPTTTKYAKPSAPPGFTGVDLQGGHPTFVPTPPVFDKPPTFGKREEFIQENLAADGTSGDPLVDSLKAAAALIGDALKKETFDFNNATIAVDTVVKNIVGSNVTEIVQQEINAEEQAALATDGTDVDPVATTEDAAAPEATPEEAASPEAVPAEAASPVAEPQEAASSAAADPVDLLKPTPTFVPNPPVFERRVKRKAVA